MTDESTDTRPIPERLSTALAAISAHEDTLGAFIALDAEEASISAAAAERRRIAGRPLGPLDGATVAITDAVDTASMPTTFGSRAFEWREPMVDATVVERLRAGGAIVLAKAKLDELSCGTTGSTTPYGDTANPWATDRISGGASGGSAAAVAAGFADIGIGTDTSGSVRLPAAHCGIAGLKPTFERVPTTRVQSCSPELDHVGPMARRVIDVADTLQIIQDPHHDRPQRLLDEPVEGLRLATLTRDWIDDAEPDVQSAFAAALDVLRSLGIEVVDLDLGLDIAQIDSDVSALCAPLAEEYGGHVDTMPEAVSPSLWHWLTVYRGLTDDDRERGLHAQQIATASVEQAMIDERLDGLLCATSRITATPRQTALTDPRSRRILNCALFSATGQPSLTVPCGFDADGLPIGLLISGHRNDDARVLQVGHAYQQATDWHERRPPLD